MISIALCAGYATRMYPLTRDFPKPLLPVSGVPILTWLMRDIDSIPQLTRHVVVSNHRFVGHFEQWAEEAGLQKPVTVLDDGSTDNANRLGAVRDVQFAIDALKIDDDLLVVAGDNLLTFSLSAMVDEFERRRASLILCYDEPDERVLRRCGVMVPDAHMRVLSMVEKPPEPPSHWAVPPFYVYARADVPRIRQAIESGVHVDAPGSLAAHLAQVSRVHALPMPGRRIDVGDLAGYEKIKDGLMNV